MLLRKDALLSLIAVERIAGLFIVKLTLLMPLIGAISFAMGPKLRLISVPLVLMAGFAMISGWEQSYDLDTLVRATQLMMMVLFFNTLVTRCSAQFLTNAMIWLIPIMGVVFIFELIVKPDMLRALLTANYYYFWKSGGADFDSGVMLMAAGNVYAASTAGICAMVAFFEGRRKLGTLALALAILTGSRALFISLLIVALLMVIRVTYPRFRKTIVMGFAFCIIIQPFFYYSIEQLLDKQTNDFLYSLSPRYVAWIAHARMGVDNVFGVGYFQGKNMTEYFWARWPIPAHNQTMVVFGEIGIFGWLCWSAFIVMMARFACASTYAAVLFIFPITMYSFIGGFNEWSLWVPLALCVALHPSYAPLAPLDWVPKFLRAKQPLAPPPGQVPAQ